MSSHPDVVQVASALQVSMRLLKQRLRQAPAAGSLTLPETSALARLEYAGATSPSELAKLEQISPQSIGATLGALEARGFIRREADPTDGRRVAMRVTKTGLRALHNDRNARTGQLANALSIGFTAAELEQLLAAAPLLERLARNI